MRDLFLEHLQKRLLALVQPMGSSGVCILAGPPAMTTIPAYDHIGRNAKISESEDLWQAERAISELREGQVPLHETVYKCT